MAIYRIHTGDYTIKCRKRKELVCTLGFEPQDGCKVIVSGPLSVYEQRGSYQIIVETMELAGEGAILRMLEERKRKLAQEGLFDPERKRPLLFFPLRVAVITSPTGAAVAIHFLADSSFSCYN